MTAEQLRNSILQEAISGRLVPQDPNDEPAAMLLEKFEARRAELIVEKKVKLKDNVPLPIKEDDIPYELPAGWCWCRIAQYTQKVTDFVASGSFASLRENVKYYDTPNYAVLVRTKDFRANFSKDLVYTDKHGYEFLENSRLFGGEMILPNIGASIGKVFIVPTLPFRMTLAPNSVMTRFFFDYQREWLYYFFLSPFGQETLSSISSATAQGKFNKTEFKQILFPLPPLAEQKRIVAKLEELLPIVEQYGKAQKELDELNTALPARLRQSILQEAISGRLIPQDPNETADELKEQLLQAVNNSPFKKKWNSELIEDEELPFDIPDNWRRIRLGDIVYTLTGLSYSKGDLEKKVSNPIRVLRGGNIQSGSWCTKDDDVMIAPEFVKKDIFLKKNSFITPAVTSLEHLGKTALIREDHDDIVAGGFVLYLMPYDDRNDSLMEYLAYFFQSAFYNSFCKTITNKSGQAFWNISREKLLKLPIPLPPLAEQQRIVAKIEELFEQIDKISQ